MMKTIKSLFFGFIMLLLCNSGSGAPVSRALIIGIDNYNPTGTRGRWQNLDGCINDALSIKEVLQARYGFLPENITLLQNQEAARDKILGGFNNLLMKSAPGDIAVIYYAGHGSQVKNSLSEEDDKRDESMVPADSYLGTKDIRDKELAAMFNKFADKGVILTILYDCCHSGSIGRGPMTNDTPKLRYITGDESYDAMDPSLPVAPEKKGVLIMSASQDFEYASEQYDADGNPHGAFTIALLQSLTTLPVNSSASDLFSSVRAILKYNGKKQEPILAGTEERKKQTLFGIEKGALSGKTLVAVMNVKGSEIILQGGIALGIYIDSELERTIGQASPVKIKITASEGLNRCKATITSGNIADIKPGDLFELKSWSLPEGATLKVYIPESAMDYDQLVTVTQQLYKIAENKKYMLIDDPVKTAPTHAIFYQNGSWFLGLPNMKSIDLGAKPAEKKITDNLPAGAKIYISLPPTPELKNTLIERYKESTAVEPQADTRKAQYYLSGRWHNNQLEYAYILPQVSGQDTAFDLTMPLRTDYFKFENTDSGKTAIADSLVEYSLRLAKIKAWLTLSGPPDDGSFPFNLRLKNAATNQIIYNNQEVKMGDILGLVMETDNENVSSWDGSKRYIYVFNIDCKGKMMLLFPLSGSVENRMPRVDDDGKPFKEMNLGSKTLFKVTEPLGTDTYIMLAANEPIPNPDVLNQPGVITRGPKPTAMQDLLNIGTRTRGELITPSEWGIQKIVVKSKP